VSVYIANGKVYGQVTDGAVQLTIIYSPAPPPEGVVPVVPTVEGFDEQL
jgi:hypothetical protein